MVATAMAAAPGVAHEPQAHRQLNPSHFNGDGDSGGHGDAPPGETNEAQVVSDRFDGIDRRYSLRSIATLGTRYYDWYLCRPGRNPFQGECTRMARDTTPTNSKRPRTGIGRVASFSTRFNIPTEGIPEERDVVGVACIDGPPPRAAHCRIDRLNVHFDDGSTSDHPFTDSGRILQPRHGRAVSNRGFLAVAFTSQSDIGRIVFCLDKGTSPTSSEDQSPGRNGTCDEGSRADSVPDDHRACDRNRRQSGIQVPAGADCWVRRIDPPDRIEFSLGIVEVDDPSALVSSGSGDCEGDTWFGDGGNDGDDCQLDKIYLTSVPPRRL